MSVPCSDSWYSLLVSMPPMRIGGGTCMNTRMPGTCESFGASWAMICCTPGRSERGLSRMNMKPWLEPPMVPRDPTLDMNCSM